MLIFRRRSLPISAIFLAVCLAAHANLVSTPDYQFTASADAGSSGTVAETITTVPGQSYKISFDGNLSSPFVPTSLNFTFGDLLNESLAGDLGHQYYLWYFQQQHSSSLTFNYFATADAASTTLGFQYYLTGENYGMSVRNLSVTLVPDGASTAALLSLAGTGLFFTRRWAGRRR